MWQVTTTRIFTTRAAGASVRCTLSGAPRLLFSTTARDLGTGATGSQHQKKPQHGERLDEPSEAQTGAGEEAERQQAAEEIAHLLRTRSQREPVHQGPYFQDVAKELKEYARREGEALRSEEPTEQYEKAQWEIHQVLARVREKHIKKAGSSSPASSKGTVINVDANRR
ncbi:hypothetical protein QOT17_001789 [Balamuthia mandrillaris]